MTESGNKIAIISVSDKTNIEKIAKKLVGCGYIILSTGGTAKYLNKHKISNVSISDFTKFDEILGGRVKTLHPIIHAGILAKKSSDLSNLKDDYKLIDFVLVNLYPFEQTISKTNCSYDNAIENIDIGGPTMLRAAAKNHKRVTTLVDPNDYDLVIDELINKGNTSLTTRKRLALKVFEHTSHYDSVISEYLSKKSTKTDLLDADKLSLTIKKLNNLRYGENPHQKAAIYKILNTRLSGFNFSQKSGKLLSYNNLVDSESAYSCVKQFKNPACVIVKHANPCGVSESITIEKAYLNSFKCDPTSAFGGIIAFNRKLTSKLLNKIIKNQFVEVILSPGISKDCLSVIKDKPNVRILVIQQSKNDGDEYDIRSLKNKILIQNSDTQILSKKDLVYPTKRKPTKTEVEDLLFAFKVSRFVKSNAIVFARNKTTLGIGAGQMSRIDSTTIAKDKAKKSGVKLNGSVMVSEAFFPFRDNIDLAKKIGVSSILQPGGSIKDKEIIKVADSHKISMAFSGLRVFRH